MPRFASFRDTPDEDMGSYITRFERHAKLTNIPKENWATCLSNCLHGRALDVYSRLDEKEANDYDKLKNALFLRYNLTEDGYRSKFRTCRPEKDENP